jgi:hypothetical protein
MRITDDQLKLFLLDSNLVPKDRLESAVADAVKRQKKLGEVLLEAKLIDEAGLQKVYAYVLGIPFVDLTKETIPLETLQIVPEPIARKYNIVAFRENRVQLEGGHAQSRGYPDDRFHQEKNWAEDYPLSYVSREHPRGAPTVREKSES